MSRHVDHDYMLNRNGRFAAKPWPDGDAAIPATVQQLNRAQTKTYADQVCSLMRQRLGVEAQPAEDQWFVEFEGLIYYLDPDHPGKLAVRSRCPRCGRLREGHITVSILADWARAHRELNLLCADCRLEEPAVVEPPAATVPEPARVTTGPAVPAAADPTPVLPAPTVPATASMPAPSPPPTPAVLPQAGLRERAQEAYERAEQERLLQQRQQEEIERIRRVDRLVRLLREALRVTVQPDNVTSDSIEIDGIAFSALPFDHDYYLHAQVACPKCGENNWVMIESLAQLGQVLAEPPCCRSCAQLNGAATPLGAGDETAEVRLVAALRELVTQAVA